jgi:hypothetical protein
MHRSNLAAYSITSSARASSDGETVKPSAFAVLRLTASRYQRPRHGRAAEKRDERAPLHVGPPKKTQLQYLSQHFATGGD